VVCVGVRALRQCLCMCLRVVYQCAVVAGVARVAQACGAFKHKELRSALREAWGKKPAGYMWVETRWLLCVPMCF
jgi:hypothetical protein